LTIGKVLKNTFLFCILHFTLTLTAVSLYSSTQRYCAWRPRCVVC